MDYFRKYPDIYQKILLKYKALNRSDFILLKRLKSPKFFFLSGLLGINCLRLDGSQFILLKPEYIFENEIAIYLLHLF